MIFNKVKNPKYQFSLNVSFPITEVIMDNYEVKSKLGSGACSFVYLARSMKNNRLYALKKIRLDEGRKTRTKTAVLKEARYIKHFLFFQ